MDGVSQKNRPKKNKKYLVEGRADGSNGTSKQRNQSDHRGEEIKSKDPSSSLVVKSELKSGQDSSCHRMMLSIVVAPPGLSPDWGEILGRRSGGGGGCNERSPPH